MKISKLQISKIKEHLISCYPDEGCGYLYKDRKGTVRFKATPNVAANKEDEFEIDDKQIKHQVEAIIHSHPKEDFAIPSYGDISNSVSLETEYAVASTSKDSCSDLVFINSEDTPLAERHFHYGVYDCWNYCRKVYLDEYKISLENVARSWNEWEGGECGYQRFKDFGFSEVQDLRVGDIVLYCLRSKVPNHAAVYIATGVIGHHLCSGKPVDFTRFPAEESFKKYEKHIWKVIRYDKV